jgi:hypothetical protein
MITFKDSLSKKQTVNINAKIKKYSFPEKFYKLFNILDLMEIKVKINIQFREIDYPNLYSPEIDVLNI